MIFTKFSIILFKKHLVPCLDELFFKDLGRKKISLKLIPL